MRKISLLSVVKEKNGQRYMAVEQIVGEWVDCAWFENGLRQTQRFPLKVLEVVPALGSDQIQWIDALRAGTHVRVS